jgi:hypothetical protein
LHIGEIEFNPTYTKNKMQTIKEITGKVEKNQEANRKGSAEGNFYAKLSSKIGPGMNERVQKLRKLSFDAIPSLAIERALHQTTFYKENNGKYPVLVMRALSFLDHCRKKALYFGEGELIVGERGPKPKAVPTFPELTCHSVEDFLRQTIINRTPFFGNDNDYADDIALQVYQDLL